VNLREIHLNDETMGHAARDGAGMTASGMGSTVAAATGNPATDTANWASAVAAAGVGGTIDAPPGQGYVLSQSIKLLQGQTLRLNGSSLQRADQLVTTTTTPIPHNANPGNVALASAAGFRVGDELAFVNASDATSSHAVTITSIAGNTINVSGATLTRSGSTMTGTITVVRILHLIEVGNAGWLAGEERPVSILGPGLIRGNAARNTAIQMWEHQSAVFSAANSLTIAFVDVEDAPGEGFQNNGGADIQYLHCRFRRVRGNATHPGGFGTRRYSVIGCKFFDTNQNVTQSGVGPFTGKTNAYDHVSGALGYSNNNFDVVLSGNIVEKCGARGFGAIVARGSSGIGNHRTTVTANHFKDCDWGVGEFDCDVNGSFAALATRTSAAIAGNGTVSVVPLVSAAGLTVGDWVVIGDSAADVGIQGYQIVALGGAGATLDRPVRSRSGASLPAGTAFTRPEVRGQFTFSGNTAVNCYTLDVAGATAPRAFRIAARNVTLSGNTLKDSPVYMAGARDVQVAGNTIDASGLLLQGAVFLKAAIVVDAASSRISIKDNRIRGAGWHMSADVPTAAASLLLPDLVLVNSAAHVQVKGNEMEGGRFAVNMNVGCVATSIVANDVLNPVGGGIYGNGSAATRAVSIVGNKIYQEAGAWQGTTWSGLLLVSSTGDRYQVLDNKIVSRRAGNTQFGINVGTGIKTFVRGNSIDLDPHNGSGRDIVADAASIVVENHLALSTSAASGFTSATRISPTAGGTDSNFYGA
jgi:hypothetical protein